MRYPRLQFRLRGLITMIVCSAVILGTYLALEEGQEKRRVSRFVALVDWAARWGVLTSTCKELTEGLDAEMKADGGRSAIPYLAALLGEEKTAPFASYILAQFGAPAVPALAQNLKSDHPESRGCAAMQLGNMGPVAASAIPQLRTMLDDDDGWVRLYVAWALWRTEQSADLAVSAIANEINSPDARIRREAAELLGSIGPAARAAVPALVYSLEDEDEYVRLSAILALGQIQGGNR